MTVPSTQPYLQRTRIAYFSMEIGIRPEMHTYSGGWASSLGTSHAPRPISSFLWSS